MNRLVNVLVLVFVGLGVLLVLLQLVGAVTLQPGLITGALDWLGPPAYGIAAIAGMLAFLLDYRREDRATDEW